MFRNSEECKMIRKWLVLFICADSFFFSGCYLFKTRNLHGFRSTTCGHNQFQCRSLECISADSICDGILDCTDSSDESGCAYFPCPSFAFKCSYGGCISPDLVCDGVKDCRDNSDESPYRCNGRNTHKNCSRLQFLCQSGECIDDSDLCDGKINCLDGTDETRQICRQLRCPKFAFRCSYGACINVDLRCNGRNDCIDGSDEMSCNKHEVNVAPNNCSITQFYCNSGECIDDFDLCDGKPNCRDASDETRDICLRINCPKYAFQCDYGGCINRDLQCNGQRDCQDGTDEINCPDKQEFPTWTHMMDPRGNTNQPELIPVTASTDIVCTTKTRNVHDFNDACPVPVNIINGWNMLSSGEILIKADGQYAKKFTTLRFDCHDGYVLQPENATAVCNNGWTSMPVCARACPAMYASRSMNVKCFLYQKEVSCERPQEGIKAIMSCTTGYTVPNYDPATEFSRLCSDGSWDTPLLNCVSRVPILSK